MNNQETWIGLGCENAAQREKIAELEATIEQLKSQHADERAILNKRVEMAESFAKRSATIRQVCADRADRATKRCEIYAERAERVGKHIKADVEQTGKARELMAEQEKSADSPEQLTDKRSNELAVEAVENIFKLADVPEQPANTQIDCDLPAEAAKSQDKLTKVPEQPADKRDSELADKTAEIQDKAAKKTNFFKTMVGKVAELLRAHQ
ncbi:hypothetical protein IWW56_006449, partial [Coemansia sp. RSA 2131]